MTVSETLTLRLAVPADIEAMSLVLERANAQRDGLLLPETVLDDKKRIEISERIAKPEAWAHIATFAGKMAGFVQGHPSAEEVTVESNPEGEYLALLMIEPTYWGNGLGKLLLSAAAGTARANNKKQMTLWTAKSNERARSLYERMGYQITPLTRTSQRQGLLVHYLMNL